MAARRHERTAARQAALQLLYSAEIAEKYPSEVIAEGAVLDEDGAFSDYARSLIGGIEEHIDEIDDCIVDASENWALDRMPIVDRSLLRLAVYEMLYVDAVPLSVSINEAVELAKAFGGEDESPRFVNGVLGRIAEWIEADRAEKGEAAPAAGEGASDEDAAPAQGDGADLAADGGADA